MTKKKWLRDNWKPLIFSLSIIIFIVIVNLLLSDNLSTFDNFIYSIVSKLKCNFVTYLFKGITYLCSTPFVLIVTVMYMLLCKNKRIGFYVALNVILCVLLNQFMKLLFTRDRPLDIGLIVENGYSFPSGHSMVSLALYGFFIYLIYHSRLPVNKRYLYIACLSILIVLIGISRIYLGVHYASDVLGGFALSMAYLILFIQFVYRRRKR